MMKAPTWAERSCMSIVLFLLFCPASSVILYQSVLLVNLHWLLVDLRTDNLLLPLVLKHFPLGVYETASIYVFILLGLATDVIYLYRV